MSGAGRFLGIIPQEKTQDGGQDLTEDAQRLQLGQLGRSLQADGSGHINPYGGAGGGGMSGGEYAAYLDATTNPLRSSLAGAGPLANILFSAALQKSLATQNRKTGNLDFAESGRQQERLSMQLSDLAKKMMGGAGAGGQAPQPRSGGGMAVAGGRMKTGGGLTIDEALKRDMEKAERERQLRMDNAMFEMQQRKLESELASDAVNRKMLLAQNRRRELMAALLRRDLF